MNKKKISVRKMAFIQMAIDAEEGLKKIENEDSDYARAVRKNWSDFDPVLKDLEKAGFEVENYRWAIEGYIRNHPSYMKALPILLEWLPKIDNIDIKCAIVGMLMHKKAKIATPILIKEFKNAQKSRKEKLRMWGQYQFSIGNALSYVADDGVFDEIVSIVRNKEYEESRFLVVLALANMKNPQAISVLIEQLQDDVLCGMAIKALRKLKAYNVKNEVERFISHKNSDVRKEAKSFLLSMQKFKDKKS